MFLVISTPVLEAMLTVWEVTDDDLVIRKIIESLWGFTSICMGFNLKNILNNLIQILVKKIFKNLNKSKNVSSPLVEPKEDYVRLNNSKHLLSLDFTLLINRNFKNIEISSKNDFPENDNYLNKEKNDNDENDINNAKDVDNNVGNDKKANLYSGESFATCIYICIYICIYVYIHISIYI
jgi:hypothetical protein